MAKMQWSLAIDLPKAKISPCELANDEKLPCELANNEKLPCELAISSLKPRTEFHDSRLKIIGIRLNFGENSDS